MHKAEQAYSRFAYCFKGIGNNAIIAGIVAERTNNTVVADESTLGYVITTFNINTEPINPVPVAIFQEIYEGDYTGEKMYFYSTSCTKFWVLSVGKKLNKIPVFPIDSGNSWARSEYNTINDLVEYFKDDSIVLISAPQETNQV